MASVNFSPLQISCSEVQAVKEASAAVSLDSYIIPVPPRLVWSPKRSMMPGPNLTVRG